MLRQVYDGKRIGVKFTPSAFNSGLIKPDGETIATYDHILDKLNGYGLAYVHLVGPAVDLKGTAIEALRDDYFFHYRKIYKGTLMANLGFTQKSGNDIIEEGLADLVSFGALYIANPDLVERFGQYAPLAAASPDTYYTGGEKGYIDYPPHLL